MTQQEHIEHTKPLKWLVNEKLHKGVSFEQRVVNMRNRRWRDKLTPKPNMMPDEDEEPNNEPQD